MRAELAKIKYVRDTFQGQVSKFGTKSGYKGPLPTVCLTNIVKISSGAEVTDHLWFNLTKGFAALNLQPGDTVRFVARVRPYVKGYIHRDEDNREVDYKLSHPTKCSVVSRCAVQHVDVSRDVTKPSKEFVAAFDMEKVKAAVENNKLLHSVKGVKSCFQTRIMDFR